MNNVIGLAGDWHGHLQWQKHALYTLGEAGVETVLHAGDYGVAWPGNWPSFVDSAEAVCKRYGMYLYVTPGNHENWDWINSREYDESGLYWMTDHVALMQRNALLSLGYGPENANGSNNTRLVHSLGGAPSIDYQFRTQGIDWWKEEVLTYGDVVRAREIGRQNEVDIMVTHDSPDQATDRVQYIIDNPDHTMWSFQGLAYSAEGRSAMNHAVAGVKPKVLVHGHFHAADMKATDETLYVSLGCNNQENNLALLNLETLEAEWLPIMQDITEVEKRKKAEDSERRNAQRGA